MADKIRTAPAYKGGKGLNRLFTLAPSSFKQLFEEIVAWFYDFFNPELEGYVNFDFGGGDMVNIRVIVFGIFIGVFLASLYMVYVKNIVGAFVRKLLAEDCLSPEKAQTLDALGFARNPFVKYALRGSLLASTVVQLKEPITGENGEEQTVPTRYYIKEEKKYIAEMRFNARGSGIPTVLFVLLISVICIFVIFGFLPQILRFVDNTISIFSVKGNTIK